jgi:ADP-ribosylglycohydrolase
MIGAIIGDVVGSIYEFNNIKTKEFQLFKKESTFTDDTIMTAAVAQFSMDERGVTSQARLCGYLHKWYLEYPSESYGNRFSTWISDFDTVNYTDFKPYNSFGNGAAMRISPIGDSSISAEQAVNNAKFVTEVSHNHPEGIKGAQSIAELIFMARFTKDKYILKKYIQEKYSYDLERSVDVLRKVYKYNETCQETVPEAIICFLESNNFEDAVRNAISIGGDSDTLAAITGSIAEAYYQVISKEIINETMDRLPLEVIKVLKNFYRNLAIEYPTISKTVLNYGI